MLVMMKTAYNNCFPFKATNTCVLNHRAVFGHLKFLFLSLDLFTLCVCVGGWGAGVVWGCRWGRKRFIFLSTYMIHE